MHQRNTELTAPLVTFTLNGLTIAAPADRTLLQTADDHGIEIGTSFGPLHGKVWRIGTMGYNARKDAVVTTLAALEHALRRAGHAVPQGGGVDAALDVYAAAVSAGVSGSPVGVPA